MKQDLDASANSAIGGGRRHHAGTENMKKMSRRNAELNNTRQEEEGWSYYLRERGRMGFMTRRPPVEALR